MIQASTCLPTVLSWSWGAIKAVRQDLHFLTLPLSVLVLDRHLYFWIPYGSKCEIHKTMTSCAKTCVWCDSPCNIHYGQECLRLVLCVYAQQPQQSFPASWDASPTCFSFLPLSHNHYWLLNQEEVPKQQNYCAIKQKKASEIQTTQMNIPYGFIFNSSWEDKILE